MPLDGIVKLAVDVAVVPVPLGPEYTTNVAVAVCPQNVLGLGAVLGAPLVAVLFTTPVLAPIAESDQDAYPNALQFPIGTI